MIDLPCASWGCAPCQGVPNLGCLALPKGKLVEQCLDDGPALLRGVPAALHVCCVHQHLAHGENGDQCVKLLHIAGVPLQESREGFVLEKRNSPEVVPDVFRPASKSATRSAVLVAHNPANCRVMHQHDESASTRRARAARAARGVPSGCCNRLEDKYVLPLHGAQRGNTLQLCVWLLLLSAGTATVLMALLQLCFRHHTSLPYLIPSASCAPSKVVFPLPDGLQSLWISVSGFSAGARSWPVECVHICADMQVQVLVHAWSRPFLNRNLESHREVHSYAEFRRMSSHAVSVLECAQFGCADSANPEQLRSNRSNDEPTSTAIAAAVGNGHTP